MLNAIYIYIYVCVCVCVCVQYFSTTTKWKRGSKDKICCNDDNEICPASLEVSKSSQGIFRIRWIYSTAEE